MGEKAAEIYSDSAGLGEVLLGKRVHMIGIGGCGMSGAGRMLLQEGAVVSGSDMDGFGGMGELVERGAQVTIGHDCNLISGEIDLVIASAAIPDANVELVAARAKGLRVIKYAELLGLLMRHRIGVAIAGTHGKSTTTAMCAHAFRTADLSPSFVVGAYSHQLGGHGGVGAGPHFIVESCEYDRSFLHLHPSIAAILNIEPDHLDCYKDLDDILCAFRTFANQVSADGVILVNGADHHAVSVASNAPARVETFGKDESNDWQMTHLRRTSGCFGFELSYRGQRLGEAQLAVPGLHNVENAVAAAALSYHAGAEPACLLQGLSSFEGISRRLALRTQAAGVTVVDDYAHHPTEIRVSIEAAKMQYPHDRLLVVFQPHQYARTMYLLEDFACSFDGADEIIVPAIYGARESDEKALSDGSKELVSKICHNGGHARFVDRLDDVADHVTKNMCEGDLVLTMGAGDVWKVADELVERICK